MAKAASISPCAKASYPRRTSSVFSCDIAAQYPARGGGWPEWGCRFSQTVWLRKPAAAAAPATERSGSRGSSRGSLLLAVDQDPVDDVHAENEDAERPPGVVFADRKQGPDRAEAAGDDPDQPSVGRTAHQREAAGELDHPEDDQHPAKGVEVCEYEPRVVDEDVRIVEGADAVDDVDRAHNQQHDGCEHDPTRTSHGWLPSVAGRFIATAWRRQSSRGRRRATLPSLSVAVATAERI